MRIDFLRLHFVLFVLTLGRCFAQESNQLVFIEGKITKADGAPWAGQTVSFSNGSSVVTNSFGRYFNVLPSGFTGSSTPNLTGNGSPPNRSYANLLADQFSQDFMGGTFRVTGGIFTRAATFFPNVGIYFEGFWQGAVSDARGEFAISIPQGYSGRVIPLSIGSSFTPSASWYAGPSGNAFTQVSYAGETAFWAISTVSQSPCLLTNSSGLFPSTTATIYVHVLAYTGNRVDFSWYDPSGILRRQTSYTPDLSSNCAVSSIDVAGTEVAQSPGVWRVDFTGSAGGTGSISFVVLPQKPPVTIPPSLGSMAHLASGDGWKTTIELVNAGGIPAQARIGFFADDGNPLFLPVVAGFPPASSIARTVSPNAIALIDSNGQDALQTGYSQLTTDAGISGFIRFRYAPQDQEAIIPLETRKATSYILAFDNTNGIATGAAVANLTAAAVNVPVLVRDNKGAQIGSASVSLPASGHASFVLSDRFASTKNQTGTIEFYTPVDGQISVIGLRFPLSARFTTIPVIANTDVGGGLMAHLAVGDGWTTTIELVNSGAKFAQAHLKFFGDNGVPLSLPWTLLGTSSTAPAIDQTMAPHARLVIESNAAVGEPLQIGSAQLTTDGSVSGFIRFRYGPRDQEALVPIEARNASSYILPFDNTNGLQTGVAIAGAGGAPFTVPVLIRDSTGARIGLGTVVVPANGHSAFVLSDQFPITASTSGTVEFGTPAGGQISLLGFRFPHSGAFSTIPVLTP